jgi:hypothetical protein
MATAELVTIAGDQITHVASADVTTPPSDADAERSDSDGSLQESAADET